MPPTALRDEETGEPLLDDDGNFKLPPDILIVPDPTWVDPVAAAHVTDPDTGAVVTSRGDLTMVVNHPPPSLRRLVVHSDGTRVVRDPDGGCAWRVEREGFAAVHAPSDVNEPITVDLGAALAAVDRDGGVAITLQDGSAVAADANATTGHVAYAPAASSADPARAALDALRGTRGAPEPGVFVFDLVKRRILVRGDDTTAGFSVKADGTFAPTEAFDADSDAEGADGADGAEGAEGGDGAEGGEDATGSSPGSSPPPPPLGHVSAPEVKPRCFVVYPDQECYFEVLSEPAFAQYADAMARDGSCTVTCAPVAGSEPGVVNHTYLAPLKPPPRPSTSIDADHVPVAPPKPSRPSSAGPTIPSLRLPSKPAFPAPPEAMIVPRIAAFEAPKPRADPPPSAFVFRQVVEYPRMTDQLAGWLDASLAKFKAHRAENAAVTPDAYVLDDARGSSFVDAERTLCDRILAARIAKEKAYADRVTAEDEARLERERLEHEAAMEAAAEAARNLKIAPRAKTPPPRPKPMYPPCGYFESAEGLTSLETMKDAFENAFENPSLRRLPSPRLPRAVKVADPEPADPRSWDGAFGDHEAYIDEVYDGGEAYAHTQNTYDDRYDRYDRHVADSRHPPSAFGASTGAKPDRVRAETEYLARPEGYLYRRRETQRAHEAHAARARDGLAPRLAEASRRKGARGLHRPATRATRRAGFPLSTRRRGDFPKLSIRRRGR